MDFLTLNLLFRCGKEFSHETIRLRELSDTECMICSYVNSHGGCSQDEVASALKADKTTVGKALSSLEKKGCVARAQDAFDKRIKRLNLTEKGRERIAELADLHDRWLSQVLTCLSDEERKRFEAYCERLLAAAEELNQKHGGT